MAISPTLSHPFYLYKLSPVDYSHKRKLMQR